MKKVKWFLNNFCIEENEDLNDIEEPEPDSYYPYIY